MSYLEDQTTSESTSLPSGQPYEILAHKKAKRYIDRSIGRAKWQEIQDLLRTSPKWDGHISHLKAELHCNHKWKGGRHRILYKVLDKEREVRVFKAGSRQSVYD